MSEKYTATGIIETINEQQTRGSFTFQTFTLELPDEKYPQFVEMQLASRNMSEIAKTFNTLDCWRIEPVAGQNKAPADAPSGDEDIPF